MASWVDSSKLMSKRSTKGVPSTPWAPVGTHTSQMAMSTPSTGRALKRRDWPRASFATVLPSGVGTVSVSFRKATSMPAWVAVSVLRMMAGARVSSAKEACALPLTPPRTTLKPPRRSKMTRA